MIIIPILATLVIAYLMAQKWLDINTLRVSDEAHWPDYAEIFCLGFVAAGTWVLWGVA